ncbi:MAG: response regulator [Verrucomicrobia bacterium]|nr:response regulator [Verrucomicrobiota bacterium]
MNASAEPRHKILVVEDEAVIAMEIEMRLAKLDYEVIGPAATGEKALSLAASDRPNLALMDINIVGPQDGVATAGQLRELFEIPVIFLTAYADDASIHRAAVSGPMGYLTKPFSDRDLHAAIEVALYKHATDREIRRYREQLEKTVGELRAALAQVKTLKALLPICASCMKIRDDNGNWDSVDAYIIKEGLGQVTHSICPACIRKLYPEDAERILPLLPDPNKNDPTPTPSAKSASGTPT